MELDSRDVDPASVVALRGISKRYPGVLALSEVDFTLRPGTVHAISGENGAAIRQGASVVIDGSGFEAGDVLTALIDAEAVVAPSALRAAAAAPVAIGEDTVVVGEGTVRDNGEVSWNWKVPADFALGAHEVSVTTAEGDELAAADFTVLAAAVDPGTPPGTGTGNGNGTGYGNGAGNGTGAGNGSANGTIANTGFAIGGGVAGALALLVLGAAGVMVRRRRVTEQE